MNIGLIDCNAIFDKHPLPLGLLRLAAVAENSGHNVELVQLDRHILPCLGDQNWKSFPLTLANLIGRKPFDILGFSARGDTLPLIIEIARQHKLKYKNVKIILGGPGVAFVAENILCTFPFIDIVVCGEGEQTFAELLSALECHDALSDIKGIIFKNACGKIVKTPIRPLLKNLDLLPAIPYHLVDGTLMKPEFQRIGIEVGRGCPNGCRFCTTCTFWGRTVRMRSPQKILAEMKMLNQKYGIRSFVLIHDNIFSNRKFIQNFCRIVRNNLPGANWSVSVSLNFITPEIVKTVASSGCTRYILELKRH